VGGDGCDSKGRQPFVSGAGISADCAPTLVVPSERGMHFAALHQSRCGTLLPNARTLLHPQLAKADMRSEQQLETSVPRRAMKATG
jgi:hypothetical protein